MTGLAGCPLFERTASLWFGGSLIRPVSNSMTHRVFDSIRWVGSAAVTEHSNQRICVRAALPSRRARCGAGAGCSVMKYQSLWNVGGYAAERRTTRIWFWSPRAAACLLLFASQKNTSLWAVLRARCGPKFGRRILNPTGVPRS